MKIVSTKTTEKARGILWLGFLFVLFFLHSCTRSSDEKSGVVLRSFDDPSTEYYLKIPITKIMPLDAPRISICIDDAIYSPSLDLGSMGVISLSEACLNQVHSKTFDKVVTRFGASGKEYDRNQYNIPHIQCEKIHYYNLPVLEENHEQTRSSVFVSDSREPSPSGDGHIGWQLYRNTCLLIDMKNQHIACCDSLSSLQKGGYDPDQFVSEPLLLDRGLVEFMLETPSGSVRCNLDSGSTFNLRNAEAPPEVSIGDRIFDEKYRGEISSVRMGGRDFGSVGFQSVPIRLPIPIDLVLGMEFIENHLIFIDFVRERIYFGPTERE